MVANFDDKEADVKVNIPLYAFNTLRISEGARTATELLTGRSESHAIDSHTPFQTAVPAHGAVVWKWTD